MLDWSSIFNIAFAAAIGALTVFFLVSIVVVAVKGKRKCNAFDVVLRIVATIVFIASAALLAAAVFTILTGSFRIDVIGADGVYAAVLVMGESLTELPLPELFAALSTLMGLALSGALFVFSVVALIVDCLVANKKTKQVAKKQVAQKTPEQLKREAELNKILKIGEDAVKRAGHAAKYADSSAKKSKPEAKPQPQSTAQASAQAQATASAQTSEPPKAQQPAPESEPEKDWRTQSSEPEQPTEFVGLTKTSNPDFDTFDSFDSFDDENAEAATPDDDIVMTERNLFEEEPASPETENEAEEQSEPVEEETPDEAYEEGEQEEDYEQPAPDEFESAEQEEGEVYEEQEYVDDESADESIEPDSDDIPEQEYDSTEESFEEQEQTDEYADDSDEYAADELEDEVSDEQSEQEEEFGQAEEFGQEGELEEEQTEEDELEEEQAEESFEAEEQAYAKRDEPAPTGRVAFEPKREPEPEPIAEKQEQKPSSDYAPDRGIYIPRIRTIVRNSGANVSPEPVKSKGKAKPVAAEPAKNTGKATVKTAKAKPATTAKSAPKKTEPKKSVGAADKAATKSSSVKAAPKKAEPKKSAPKKAEPKNATPKTNAGTKKADTTPPEKKLPITRRYVILDRRNAVNMFGEYLKERNQAEKDKLKSSLDTIIIK